MSIYRVGNICGDAFKDVISLINKINGRENLCHLFGVCIKTVLQADETEQQGGVQGEKSRLNV